MDQEKKKLLKDLLFCLQLGFRIIGIFLLAVVIGMQLDKYYKTRPAILLLMLFVAFGYVIKILLGAGKR